MMTKSLKAALISFALAIVVLLLLMGDEGLADGPDGISITPPIWLESKFMKWDENEGWWDYFVYGWWFTDGDYWHVGQYRTFEVSRDVAINVLILDGEGRMTRRLCRLGFIDGSTIAAVYTCVNGTQAFLALVE